MITVLYCLLLESNSNVVYVATPICVNFHVTYYKCIIPALLIPRLTCAIDFRNNLPAL